MNHDPYAARFAVIQLVRWSGVVLSVVGLLAISGRFDWPRPAGHVLFLVGLIAAFFAPALLARHWKSPKP